MNILNDVHSRSWRLGAACTTTQPARYSRIAPRAAASRPLPARSSSESAGAGESAGGVADRIVGQAKGAQRRRCKAQQGAKLDRRQVGRTERELLRRPQGPGARLRDAPRQRVSLDAAREVQVNLSVVRELRVPRLETFEAAQQGAAMHASRRAPSAAPSYMLALALAVLTALILALALRRFTQRHMPRGWAGALLMRAPCVARVVARGGANACLLVPFRLGAYESSFVLDTGYAGAPVLNARLLGASGTTGEAELHALLAPPPDPSRTYHLLQDFVQAQRCVSYTSGCVLRLMGIGPTAEHVSDLLMCPPLELQSAHDRGVYAQTSSPAVALAGAAPGAGATLGVAAQADLGSGAGRRFPPGSGSKREKRNSVAKGAATR